MIDRLGARVLFVHAHPDDESISTGGTIAALLGLGTDVLVVTGTRGERGEVVPGPLAPLEGTAELTPHRERELAAALAALGGPRHAWLRRADGGRFVDSGMEWGADGFAAAAPDAHPLALSLAPLDEVTDALAAALGDFVPTSVVSYDARGGYGHPDHVRMREAAGPIADRLGIPLLEIVEPRVDAGEGDLVVDLGSLAAHGDGTALDAKRRAMSAHASQLTVDGDDFVLSGGQRHPIGRVEAYRRAR